MSRAGLLALAGLTLAGLALRLAGIDQSLFGDELFTYHDVEPDGFGGVIDRMQVYESNPPLYFALAWIARRVGDPTVTIRLPSLILGTAAIPAVYLLGARIAGRAAGLLAAALVAISPFAIFFATEARAYASLAFFAALSTLALLNALDGRGRPWWLLFWLASSAALYTHYTAAFVLAAQGLWAVWAHREALRALVVAHAAIAVAFVPWLPFVEENAAEQAVGGSYDLTAGTVLTAVLRVLWGHPLESLDELPGTAALVALGVALAAALAARVAAWVGLPRVPEARRRAVLVAVLALAAPVGLLAYDAAGGGDLFAPRNLSASLPALAVAVAAVVVSSGRAAAIAAAVLVLAASAAGSARLLLDDDHRRPALREIGEAIDERGRPGDTVVDSPLFFVATPPLQRGLTVHLDRAHRIFRLTGIERSGRSSVGVADPRAWRVRPGGRVFVAGYEDTAAYLLPRPPRDGPRFRVVRRERFAGLTPLTLVTYEAF